MPRSATRRIRPTEARRPIPFVGDNLDRLLGLLEAARFEQTRRARPDRESSYRALALAIAARPSVAVRNCA